MSIAVLAKLGELEEKRQKADELQEELKKSLLLEELCPGVYDGDGKVTTQVIGNPCMGMTMTIKRADGKVVVEDLSDVPVELWPWKVRRDIYSFGHRALTKYRLAVRDFQPDL